MAEPWDVCSPDCGLGVPEALRPDPRDRSALTTHATWFNVGDKREVKQGLEESYPRLKEVG